MNSCINSPVLSFTVTRLCNLNCVYCYFPNKGNKSITKEIVDFIIPEYFKFFTKGIDHVRFLLSGGEPLLEKDLVFYIMEQGQDFAQRYGKSISYTLDSNGVLLTKQVVDKLLPYDVYVMSSIDGDAKIHDAQRPFLHSDEGSHKVVVENVAYALKVLGPEKVAVRFTVLPSGIHRLYETFRYFYDFGFKIIDFAPNYEITWLDEQMRTFASEVFKVASFVMKTGVNNKLINNYMNWHLGNGNMVSAYGHPCGIIPTVDTNGDFYACHRFIDNHKFYLGDYTNFPGIIASIRNLSGKYIDYWKKYGVYGMASCPANNVCRGCHPFHVSDFFKQFITIMMDQVKNALFEEGKCIGIKKSMDYLVEDAEDNQFILINAVNGEYILLNETGSLLAQIIKRSESLTFDNLIDTFIPYLTQASSLDMGQLKEEVFSFLKMLQKERIVTLSVVE